MVKTKPVYLMVSQTDTAIARLIRTVSRYPYNHVSISPDPDYSRWYSFARYVHDAPLYSGFICEPAERFLARTGDAQVRIYKVDVQEKSYRELTELLAQAGNPDSGLIYNYFDAMACAFGQHFPVPDSYTCLSFACHFLNRDDVSIEALCRALEPNLLYEGSLAGLICDTGDRTDPYFQPLGPVRGSALSAVQMCRLTTRAVIQGFNSIMAHRFHRTVH